MSTNSFKIKNSAVLTPKDLSTLVSPEAGEIACDINDSNKIKRYDAASASWVEVGSGGVGSVDIMFVQDFESASLSSFTQTGLSLSTTNPLHGKVSAVLTHQAAVNQSFKQTIPVDPKFRGQAIVLDLNVKSAASAGNVVIKVRDESNSADLIVSEALQLSNDVSGRRSSVSFTIPSTCESLSYTITALPEAGSPVTRIDDIVAMLSDVSLLETSVLVPNLTAWQGYTPTFQGFGTPSNVEFEWRQVGESVEIRGKFTSGVSTAVEARVGLPAGLTSAGTGLIPSLQLAGTAGRTGNSAAPYSSLIEPSVGYLTFSLASATTGGILVKRNGNDLILTGESWAIQASIPCAGLSATSTKTIPLTQSGLVQEGDSSLRIQQVAGNGSTNTFIRRFTNIQENVGSDLTYIPSTTLGDSITVNSSGIYNISYTDNFNSAAVGFAIVKNYSINGLPTSVPVANRLVLNFTENVVDYADTVSWSGYLVAGDVIRFYTSVSTVGTQVAQSQVTITKQGSLKQVSVSSDQKITIPTSELRFEGASSRGSTATAIVKFDTMAKLRGDAFTVTNTAADGTAITMKKAGKLDISSSLYFNSINQTVVLTKNQTTLTSTPLASSEMLSAMQMGNAAGGVVVGVLNYSGFVNIGDIIRVSSSTTPNSLNSNQLNLAFQEQDIAVSVTNTLPQFSQSDSSVRVDTANGYGSTANKIRRFSNVRDNIGADIEYLDSATNGASFTVKSAGTYHISATDNFTAAGRIVITKNQSNLTATPGAIPSSEILRASQAAAGNSCSCSWEGYLVAGDIVRLSTDGGAVGSDAAFTGLTISKVGKPNVTGVDVTPFVNVPQPDVASYSVINSPNGFGSTYTQTPRFLSIQQNDGTGILSYTDSATLGAYWTANKKCIATISLNSIYLAASAWSFRIFKNQTGVNTGTGLTTIDDQANTRAGATISVELNVGDRISFYYSSTSMNRTEEHVFITATSTSDQILTAPETFSTDTASLSYASSSLYNLTTLANAPVGTYITFTTASGGNTHTQTTTAPSQSPADMNINGINIFSRARNVPSTAGNPARIAIQIGKGLKGLSLRLYKSTGKVNTGSLDFEVIDSAVQTGMMFKEYNEVTGILLLDSSTCWNSTNTSNSFNFSDFTQQTSGYLVINAAKSPALTGVPLLLPRIATLSDVQASGSAGAAISNGVYAAARLNTLNDPMGIVTSLASNQFVLQPGTYFLKAHLPIINGSATSYAAKGKVRNVTDGTDLLLGSTIRNDTLSNGAKTIPGVIEGSFVLTSAKTLEIQVRGSTVNGNLGLAASFGDNEIYSIITITKVK